jgi:mono/diheme cytochrome c family protein
MTQMNCPAIARRAAASLLAAFALGGVAHAQAGTPSYTAEQAKRGAELYVGTCAQCHGERLDDGQFAPALKGPAHDAYWAGKSAEDVLAYMNASMPPTQPGVLGPQGYADILAYMLQAAGAAPGDKELPADPAALHGLAATK